MNPSDSHTSPDVVMRRSCSYGDMDAGSGDGYGVRPVAIPPQRIITPVSEEDEHLLSDGSSSVKLKPILIPQVTAATSPEEPGNSQPAFFKYLDSAVDLSQVLFKKGQWYNTAISSYLHHIGCRRE